MKREPEYTEGPEAGQRFNAAMRHIITVSHDELQRRIEAENKSLTRRPKRGPKTKLKTSGRAAKSSR